MEEKHTQDNQESSQNRSVKDLPFFNRARKVLLASVGATVLAQDEIEEFVKHLINRGELAESEGTKLVEEMRERRRKNMEKAEERISKRMERMIKRLEIPTKADVDSLSDRITSISKKLDEIIERQGK